MCTDQEEFWLSHDQQKVMELLSTEQHQVQGTDVCDKSSSEKSTHQDRRKTPVCARIHVAGTAEEAHLAD